MDKPISWEELKLDTPATYRIRIQGRLDNRFKDRLSGMDVVDHTPEGQPPLTILEGHLPDQAALSGLLNTLYDLRFPLLSVEILDGPIPQADDDQDGGRILE